MPTARTALSKTFLLLAQFDGNPNSLKLQTIDLTTTIREVVEECKSSVEPTGAKSISEFTKF